MALPTQTPEQRAAAIAAATRARQERSQAKAAIRRGEVTVPAVLADEGSPLQGARIRDVLCAVPGFGPVTVDSIMTEIGIHAKRRVSALTERQRDALTAHMAALSRS